MRFRRLTIVSGFLVGLLALSTGCSDPASKLEVYGVVPSFQLTDSLGNSFDSNQLTGKVWVADFIYTHCPGPCPRMTSQMHTLEKQIEGDQDVRLVSFTVDPAQDSPPVLNNFAQRFGGPTPQWFFLTGAPETLHKLARNVFMVGDLVGVMDHSTKFILVDRKRRIRGFYSTFEPDGIAKLRKDIQSLVRSRS
jgi:protein SCO1/2